MASRSRIGSHRAKAIQESSYHESRRRGCVRIERICGLEYFEYGVHTSDSSQERHALPVEPGSLSSARGSARHAWKPARLRSCEGAEHPEWVALRSEAPLGGLRRARGARG